MATWRIVNFFCISLIHCGDEHSHLFSLAFSAVPATRFSILHLRAMVWANVGAEVFTHVRTDKDARLLGRSIINDVFPVDGLGVTKFLVITHANTASQDLGESTQADFF